MSLEVRLCEAHEIGLVMKFLHEHWARDHVLARDRALMDWQHERQDGRYNFIIASRGGDSGLLAVLGFIPTSRYDPQLAEQTVWLALWKVRPDAAAAGLGLAMLRHLTSMHGDSAVGVVGIGPAEHLGMYRALRFATGHLSQHYILNDSVTDFRIARVPVRPASGAPRSGGASLRLLADDDLRDDGALARRLRDESTIPRKSARYFRSRFFNHPVYTYELYAVEAGDRVGIVATRLAVHEGRSALRIVDYLGSESLFGEIGAGVQELLQSTGAEYADVWNAGFSPSTFAEAGFAKVEPEGAIVIPNYFEPFLQRNGRISYALRSTLSRPLAIFRADGDQDRPNEQGR